MKKIRKAVAISLAALAISAAVPFKASAAGVAINPGTPEGTMTLQRLMNAEYSDKMNSTSWSADNSVLDSYYAHKAEQVQALIDTLQSNRPVFRMDVDGALNNEGALRY